MRIDLYRDNEVPFRSAISDGTETVIFNPLTGEIGYRIPLEHSESSLYRIFENQNLLSRITCRLSAKKRNGSLLILMNRLITAYGAYRYATAPLTHEAVDFFINMGVIDMPGGTGKIAIGFPESSPAGMANSLLPWSFVFIKPLHIPGDTLITLHSVKISGDIFYSCLPIP